MRVRLTPIGRWSLVLLGGLVVLAWFTGDNLLYLLVSGLGALWGAELWQGSRNLRSIDVRRELPGDLYAGHVATGRFWLSYAGGGEPPKAVGVVEASGLGQGEIIAQLTAEDTSTAASWRFPQRGEARLTDVVLWSSWPFGLLRWERTVPAALELVVYPAPQRAEVDPLGAQALDDNPGAGGQRGSGELEGLAEWQAGDRASRLHMAATARLGTPIVVQRGTDAADTVRVDVPPGTGEAWEHALSVATGQVLRGTAAGHTVELVLAGDPLGAGVGEAWRRYLLEALAIAEPER